MSALCKLCPCTRPTPDGTDIGLACRPLPLAAFRIVCPVDEDGLPAPGHNRQQPMRPRYAPLQDEPESLERPRLRPIHHRLEAEQRSQIRPLQLMWPPAANRST